MQPSKRVPALERLVESSTFNAAILVVILANAVVLGLQTYDGIVAEHGDLLDLLNEVFLAVFVAYTGYRLTLHWSWFLFGFMLFDMVTILLVAREWRARRRLWAMEKVSPHA